ncbi:DEAD box RNA helicase CiRH22, partial [Haematococcus lacustris]
PFQFHALVLLPNGPLCQQLVSVVQSLRDTTGQPLLTAAQALRSGDRRLVEAKLFTELQLSEGDFARLPRKLQVAAWTGGSSALLAAGYRPPEPPAPDAQFGPYWRRQYVFVAATMPAVTLHDVGTQIEKLYPDAEWVATPSLHTSKTQVEHAWQQANRNKRCCI